MLQTIKNIKNLKGQRVLVRVDFNVPMNKNKVKDDARIKASLPTLNYLSKKGAQVIILTHLGRPEGKVVPLLSLKPIAKHLEKLLKKKVKFLPDLKIPKMKNGDIVMLENIRFYAGEEKNDLSFSLELSNQGDSFVLDGFAVAHRDAASVTGLQKYLPSYAGFLLAREITHLDALLEKPQKPFVAIIGGAKVETKLPVIKNILKRANKVLLGGTPINDYFHAMKYDIGSSKLGNVEKKHLAVLKNKSVIKPIDVLVGKRDGTYVKTIQIKKKPHKICEKDEEILDIGPKTIKLFEKHIAKARMIVWNGAMGYFENEMFSLGTFSVARAVAARGKKGSFVILGGGETLLTMDMLKLKPTSYIASTGGGAMLEYLSGQKLPGLHKLT